MKNLYLILLIVVIVGIVAIFALTFLTAGDQNLTGAAAWGKSCTCGSSADCKECCQPGCNTQNKCEACGGTWGAQAA